MIKYTILLLLTATLLGTLIAKASYNDSVFFKDYTRRSKELRESNKDWSVKLEVEKAYLRKLELHND